MHKLGKALPWQQQLREVIDNIDELCLLLSLNIDDLDINVEAAKDFPLRVPRSFAARIQKGNARDPLLLQVLPVAQEQQQIPGFVLDPLAEKIASPIPGLLHKYNGRVLLITTGACAVNCRYCFRRHFPYKEQTLSQRTMDRVLDYIQQETTISEVILSGGEPLLLKDELLLTLFQRLAAVPHLTTVRLHTRMPIVIPARITADLLAVLAATRLASVMVVHVNHANEIDQAVQQALLAVKQAGITLLNQTVLLKKVNDASQTLIQLSQRLFAAGALPYYLHQLDSVAGAAHFQVSDERALQIIAELRNHLPGYLVPRLVYEKPGALSKLAIDASMR